MVWIAFFAGLFIGALFAVLMISMVLIARDEGKR